MSTLDRLRRAANRHPHADVAVAAVLYAVTLVTTAAGPAASRGRLTWLALVMAAVACGSLVLRHRWPVLALVASAFAAEGYLSLFRGHEGALVLAAPLTSALFQISSQLSAVRRAEPGGRPEPPPHASPAMQS